jgi:hypothetical protein
MKHLEEVKETYWEHFLAAAGISRRLAIASWSQLLHAFCPEIKPPLGGDLRSLLGFLQTQLPEYRNGNLSEEDELYKTYGGD